MKATDPICFPGDRVTVENYRAHSLAKPVEKGRVVNVNTTWLSKNKCSHQYRVQLDRKYNGKAIHLTVNERRIKGHISINQ